MLVYVLFNPTSKENTTLKKKVKERKKMEQNNNNLEESTRKDDIKPCPNTIKKKTNLDIFVESTSSSNDLYLYQSTKYSNLSDCKSKLYQKHSEIKRIQSITMHKPSLYPVENPFTCNNKISSEINRKINTVNVLRLVTVVSRLYIFVTQKWRGFIFSV